MARLSALFAGMIILALTPSCDPATVDRVVKTAGDLANAGALTPDQIGQGLKQALDKGITEGAKSLAQQNGYFESPYKILLPEEARKVTERLQGIPGFADLEANVLQKINAGAEDAAKQAAPIFKQAIKQMTFRDATDILMGPKDAATSYLNSATYDQLYTKFQPVIIKSLDKFQARKVWSDAASKYNSIPLLEDVNPSLDEYVTQQALQGLFAMVAKEELDIRENVSARTTDLMRRVFAKQD